MSPASGPRFLPGEHLGQRGFRDEPELDQVIPDPRSVLFLLLECLFELFLRDQPFADQKVANAFT